MRSSLPFVVALFLSGPGAGRAAEPVKMSEPAKKATAKALEWLAAKQNSDGSWSEGRYPHSTAITSFALLAFLSQGHLPDQGPYGEVITKAYRNLLSSARDDGYLVGSRGGNMYGHGMATLALAELYGNTKDKEVRPALEKAVKLIVGCQSREGGWRYNPDPSGADISVTIMQVMALRAAKNCGVHVQDDTLKRAIAYIKECYDSRSGGFTYQPRRTPGFARTAAGACVLQLAGEHKAPEVPKAVEYLKQNFDAREHFWYGHYYAAHALHQYGGDDWKEWYERLCERLLPLQGGDGGWNTRDREGVGPVYQTAIAVLCLSVPMNYLPIYQR